MDLLKTFSERGELVVYLFFGTFLTAKACLELPRHYRFEDFEVDVECFVASAMVPVRLYASQILNEKMDIPGSGEELGEFKIVV